MLRSCEYALCSTLEDRLGHLRSARKPISGESNPGEE
jgi:hypothetical protein